MRKNNLAAILLILVSISLLSGCSFYNSPPSVGTVNEWFEDSKEMILFVADRLIEYDGTLVGINKKGEIYYQNGSYDLNKDEEFTEALKSLRSSGCSFIHKRRKTVQIFMWEGISDISCGVAFAADGEELDIQYLTYFEPLEIDGWYYYIADYEEWRINAIHP